MSTYSTQRQPKGIPVGGQFSATTHNESTTRLGAMQIEREHLLSKLESVNLGSVLSDDEVKELGEHLDASQNYSDEAVKDGAGQIHLRNRGYSVEDAQLANMGAMRLQLDGSANTKAMSDAIGRVLKAAPRGSAPTGIKLPSQDGFTNPIDFGDPRVQAGQIFDKVEINDRIFERVREDMPYNGDVYEMRLQANRELTEDETDQLAGMMGYAYRKTVNGESMGSPDQDSPYSFTVYADTTKGRGNLGDFEQELPSIISEGSPVRKTDRAGAGTAGTRLIEGFKDPDLTFELYYS